MIKIAPMIETTFGQMRVLDAHSHFFTRSFLTGLGAMTWIGPDARAVAQKLGWDEIDQDPEAVGRKWTLEMDRHGVEKMVAIHTLPDDLEQAAAGIAATNGRLVGYATVNPLADGALSAVERAVTQYAFRGIALFPAMFRFSMTSDPVFALLDLANRHSLNVFVHCGVLKVGFRTKLGLPSAFDATYSNPLSLQRPAAEFPKANFIVPHLGSGLLRELLMVADQCANVYTDTSGIGGWAKYLDGAALGARSADALKHAVHVMGAERILFGSDSTFFPRGWRRDLFDQQLITFDEAGLTNEQVKQILGQNLERLLLPPSS
jgi:predicted TIM-barrel fold metal-dependent hydrolase